MADHQAIPLPASNWTCLPANRLCRQASTPRSRDGGSPLRISSFSGHQDIGDKLRPFRKIAYRTVVAEWQVTQLRNHEIKRNPDQQAAGAIYLCVNAIPS